MSEMKIERLARENKDSPNGYKIIHYQDGSIRYVLRIRGVDLDCDSEGEVYGYRD